MRTKESEKQVKITKLAITDDKMSGRGGLFFFLKYVENIGFYRLFEDKFGFLRTTKKGLRIQEFIKQVLAHFIDGSDMSMTAFDRRKSDSGYAALLEYDKERLASSHQMKRFFAKFLVVGNLLFRKILAELFIVRLRIEKPKVIVLFGDTMVLDNDDADKRQGVEPTYKKKKGFQPLHLSWGTYLIDVVFRNGSAHSNHGNDFLRAVTRITVLIRKRYCADVPIILLTDSGFLDDKNLRYFEEKLKIFYVCVGKQYKELKEYVQASDASAFKEFSSKKQLWHFIEFGNRLKSWATLRRCIFTSLAADETGQLNLDFAKTDLFIYTNLGQDKTMTEQLIKAGGEAYLQPEKIIELNHQRGRCELVHRSIKELATKEQLPFEKFSMNRAYYYLMVLAHFLFEIYKRDVAYDVIATTVYPNTFRRQLIDFAAKVVATGGKVYLKVTQTLHDGLNLSKLWTRCMQPEPILLL